MSEFIRALRPEFLISCAIGFLIGSCLLYAMFGEVGLSKLLATAMGTAGGWVARSITDMR